MLIPLIESCLSNIPKSRTINSEQLEDLALVYGSMFQLLHLLWQEMEKNNVIQHDKAGCKLKMLKYKEEMMKAMI